MSAARSRSWVALNMALSVARGIPFFGSRVVGKRVTSRPADFWRWGRNGRLIVNSSGRVVHLPEFSQHTLNQIGDVLLSFPNGFCLDVEGKVVPRLDVSRLGENLARRDKDAGGQITGFFDLVHKLPKKGRNEVERVLHDGDRRPGSVHDLPFVIVVLPRSEAYSRFPEIAPSSSKDDAS